MYIYFRDISDKYLIFWRFKVIFHTFLNKLSLKTLFDVLQVKLEFSLSVEFVLYELEEGFF